MLDFVELDNNRHNLAFRELYNRYGKNLYLFCSHNSFNQDIAQNAYQEAWIALFENIRLGKKIQSVSAFLVTVCRRRIIDSIRKSGNLPDFVPVTENEEEFIIIDTDDSDSLNQIIAKAIDSLDEKYKEAFVMNKINGLKISEIAEITGETNDCIKKRVYRSSEKVKSIIQKYLRQG